MSLTDILTKCFDNFLFFFFKLKNTQFQPSDWKIFYNILELFSIIEIKQTFLMDYSSGKENKWFLRLHTGLWSVLCRTGAAKPFMSPNPKVYYSGFLKPREAKNFLNLSLWAIYISNT